MHPALRFGLEDPIVSFEAGPDAVHVEGSAAVGYIDAMGAISLHEQGLLRERSGIDHMAHHQEARDVHAEVPRNPDMLLCNVGFGAMGSDAHRADAETVRAPQFLDRSDARNQKRRQHRMFDDLSRCLDPPPTGAGPNTPNKE